MQPVVQNQLDQNQALHGNLCCLGGTDRMSVFAGGGQEAHSANFEF